MTIIKKIFSTIMESIIKQMHNLPFSLQNATAITIVPRATLTWRCTRLPVMSVEECVMTASTTLWATIVSSASPSSTSILRRTSVTLTSVTVGYSSCSHSSISHFFILSLPLCSHLFLSVSVWASSFWKVCLARSLSLSVFLCGWDDGGEEHGVGNTWSLKCC